MSTSQVIAETDEGRLVLHGNELELYDNTGSDPVAVRLRSANGGIGKISLDYPDGHGGWTELGYLFGKHDERPGMQNRIIFEFWQSGSADADARRLLEVRSDGILAHVPIIGQPVSERVTRFYTDGGRCCVNVQDDQFPKVRLVKYQIMDPNDESTWIPMGETVI